MRRKTRAELVTKIEELKEQLEDACMRNRRLQAEIARIRLLAPDPDRERRMQAERELFRKQRDKITDAVFLYGWDERKLGL